MDCSEKDYEKLQAQLSKSMKESGSRSSASALSKVNGQQQARTFIHISAPLKRTGPHVNGGGGAIGGQAEAAHFGDNSTGAAVALLRDAELRAHRATITALDVSVHHIALRLSKCTAQSRYSTVSYGCQLVSLD